MAYSPWLVQSVYPTWATSSGSVQVTRRRAIAAASANVGSGAPQPPGAQVAQQVLVFQCPACTCRESCRVRAGPSAAFRTPRRVCSLKRLLLGDTRMRWTGVQLDALLARCDARTPGPSDPGAANDRPVAAIQGGGEACPLPSAASRPCAGSSPFMRRVGCRSAGPRRTDPIRHHALVAYSSRRAGSDRRALAIARDILDGSATSQGPGHR